MRMNTIKTQAERKRADLSRRFRWFCETVWSETGGKL